MSLHEGEIAVDERLVASLLRAQAPELAALPLRRLHTTGTVNHVFRLGDVLLVRLPRLPHFSEGIEREAALLPMLAPLLPVAVPRVVVLGGRTDDYPLPWAVVRWIEGEAAEPGAVPVDALAEAVVALRAAPVGSLPAAGRPAAADADDAVRAAVAALDGFDRRAVLAAWDAALGAEEWNGVRVPIHADLLPPNLVLRHRGLAGILDWGAAGAGDPANDLVPAWSCLRGPDRARFRAALGAEDGEWARARGIALAQAVVGIPYYAESNPAFAALSRATLAQVLA